MTAAVPALQAMRVAEIWSGVIDVTPNELPVISAVDALPGFFIATGFTGQDSASAPEPGG